MIINSVLPLQQHGQHHIQGVHGGADEDHEQVVGGRQAGRRHLHVFLRAREDRPNGGREFPGQSPQERVPSRQSWETRERVAAALPGLVPVAARREKALPIPSQVQRYVNIY